MKMSPAERLIVQLICDLAKPQPSREFDFAFISKAIGNGHEWALDWKYDHFTDGPIKSPSEVTEVVEALDMWDALELGISEMDEAQQEQVKEAVGFRQLPSFQGFDGNNESRYMSIARFLVEDLDRWPRFEGRDMNSHMPKRASYRRQLAVFERLVQSLEVRARPFMSPEQVIAVVREQVHPENREVASDGSWTVRARI